MREVIALCSMLLCASALADEVISEVPDNTVGTGFGAGAGVLLGGALGGPVGALVGAHSAAPRRRKPAVAAVMLTSCAIPRAANVLCVHPMPNSRSASR